MAQTTETYNVDFPEPAFQCMRGEYIVIPTQRSGAADPEVARNPKDVVFIDHDFVRITSLCSSLSSLSTSLHVQTILVKAFITSAVLPARINVAGSSHVTYFVMSHFCPNFRDNAYDLLSWNHRKG
jgi:hypothetical protein